jgi:ligand-binding sensor domain-containing protein
MRGLNAVSASGGAPGDDATLTSTGPGLALSWLGRVARLGMLATWTAVAAAVAMAATPGPQFHVETWETEQGLPQNSGTAMVQTSDGYLWLGTFNGLVRFNGTTFTRFTTANTPELQSDDINHLHEDATGRLWIGTSAGLVSFDRGRFHRWTGSPVLDRAAIRCLANARDGVVVTADRGVWRVLGDRLTELTVPEAKWPTWASRAVSDATGQVWVSHRERLFLLQGEELRFQARAPVAIDLLEIDRDGTFWWGQGSDMLVTWRPGGFPTDSGLNLGRVRAF